MTNQATTPATHQDRINSYYGEILEVFKSTKTAAEFDELFEIAVANDESLDEDTARASVETWLFNNGISRADAERREFENE